MGAGLVRKGSSGSVSHSQATPTLALRDTYGATFSLIQNGNLFLKTTTTNPSTPSSGELTFFAKDRGKIIPSVIGPSGIDYNIQSGLWGKNTIRWVPGVLAVASIAWGNVWFPRNNGGAQTHPTKSSTDALSSLNRALFSTTATSLSSSGIQTTNTVAWRGSSGLGGFFFSARFGMSAIGSLTGVRVLVGLSVLNNVLSVDPSTINGTVAIVKDAADTTWYFLTRTAAGASTKQNTFVTVTAGQILDIYINIDPNGSVLSFNLRNAATGASLISSSIVSSIIDTTSFLYIHCQVQTTTTAISSLSLSQMYLESDI